MFKTFTDYKKISHDIQFRYEVELITPRGKSLSYRNVKLLQVTNADPGLNTGFLVSNLV